MGILQGGHFWISEHHGGRRKGRLDLFPNVVNGVTVLRPAGVEVPPDENDFPALNLVQPQASPDGVDVVPLSLCKRSDSHKGGPAARPNGLQIGLNLRLGVGIEWQPLGSKA
jgi:hypothetical protein